MKLATTVKRRRTKLKLTQAALGARVGWHGSRISRLESGKLEPRVTSLRKIAKALGCNLEALLR